MWVFQCQKGEKKKEAVIVEALIKNVHFEGRAVS